MMKTLLILLLASTARAAGIVDNLGKPNFPGFTVGQTSVYTSTMDYSKAVQGQFSVVALASFTAANSVTFTNWNSSATCRLYLNATAVTQSSAYYPRINFNGDTGNNYSGVSTCHRLETNSSVGGAYSGAAYFALFYTNIAYAGSELQGSFTIMAMPTNRGLVHLWGTYFQNDSDPLPVTWDYACEEYAVYNGAASLNSLTLSADGTMTGYATVECLMQAVAY